MTDDTAPERTPDPMEQWRAKGLATMMRGGAVTEVTVTIDHAELGRASNQQLALYWHVAQHNPASINDEAAGDLAETIGREIIRRWLGGTAPELYRHQGRHYHWGQLTRFARWTGAEWVLKPEAVAAAVAGGEGA